MLMYMASGHSQRPRDMEAYICSLGPPHATHARDMVHGCNPISVAHVAESHPRGKASLCLRALH